MCIRDSVYASMGIDPIDTTMSTGDPVNVLAEKLQRLWAQRDGALAGSGAALQ